MANHQRHARHSGNDNGQHEPRDEQGRFRGGNGGSSASDRQYDEYGGAAMPSGYDRDQDYDRWSPRSQDDRSNNDRDRGKYEADYGFPQPGDRGSRWNESGRGREYMRDDRYSSRGDGYAGHGTNEEGWGGDYDEETQGSGERRAKGPRDRGDSSGDQERQREYGSRYVMGYDTEPYGGASRSDRGGTQGYRMRNENWQAERGPHSGKGPKGYKRSDARIEEDINEALSRDAVIDASDIEVSVKHGDVTLSGTVPDRSMKRRAEDCAEECPGVHEVQNHVRVKRAEEKDSGKGDTSRSSNAAGSGKRTGNGAAAGASHANSTSGSTSKQQSSSSTQ